MNRCTRALCHFDMPLHVGRLLWSDTFGLRIRSEHPPTAYLRWLRLERPIVRIGLMFAFVAPFAAILGPPAIVLVLMHVSPLASLGIPAMVYYPATLILGAVFFEALGYFRGKRQFSRMIHNAGGELCLSCGYSLQGLPKEHCCPECHAPYSKDETMARWEGWIQYCWWRQKVALRKTKDTTVHQ